MTLFPYPGEVKYIDGQLHFILTFFDSKKTTQMTLNIDLDDNITEMIENLINQSEEV